MNTTTFSSLSKSRISAYLAGTAATLAGTAESDAAITYISVNAPIADTVLGGGGIGLDLLFDGFHLALAHSLGTTNAATGYAFADADAFGSPAVLVAGFVAGGYNYAAKFAGGADITSVNFLPVGAVATLAFNGGYGNDQFLTAGPGFIGVKFDTDRFGWVRINMDGAPLNTFTIVDMAFGAKGETVLIGQIPEPSTLGVLALGATGLVSWRRRKPAAA